MKPPDTPERLGEHGRRLWNDVLADFDMNSAEVELLEQACRIADTCAKLAALVDEEGELIETRLGEKRTHPALVELRNQRALLARVLVTLRVPVGGEDAPDGEADGETTKARGFRGWYTGDAA